MIKVNPEAGKKCRIRDIDGEYEFFDYFILFDNGKILHGWVKKLIGYRRPLYLYVIVDDIRIKAQLIKKIN